MISYELILSSAILTVILLTGSFNIISIIENQEAVWFVLPLLPMFIIFFISALAECNRTPFDLPEAESELVAGFFTEHSGMIFVFFFLGEYCSIVLMSTLTGILFFGGYNIPELFVNETFINLQSIVLGLKTCVFAFLFVWFRATLPRLRYDQLIVFRWTGMLPLAIAFVVLVPSILVAFDITPLQSTCVVFLPHTLQVRNLSSYRIDISKSNSRNVVATNTVKSNSNALSEYFTLVNEKDKGQNTTNLHILALRQLNSNNPITAQFINTLLPDYPQISDEFLTTLRSIKVNILIYLYLTKIVNHSLNLQEIQKVLILLEVSISL